MTPSLEIAHVLFMDVAAYTKLSMHRQQTLLDELQEAVRNTQEFTQAQSANNLICLPTGDGMALVFFGDPESPVRCAMELSGALRGHPDIRLRMGIHTGPVYRVADINANRNVAGGGINVAQRVMDCGDAGHILVSRAVADVLIQVGTWSEFLHDLGDVELKHGLRVHIYNLYSDEAGHAEVPTKVALARRGKTPPTPPEPWWRRARLWMRHRKRVLLGGGAAMLLLVTACVVLSWRACPAPAQHQKIMAVLPMETIGQDPDTTALGLGLIETVAAKLVEAGNNDSIQIVSPRDLRDQGVKTAEDARRGFKTDLVLEISLQRVGKTIRINCSLVDSKTRRQVAAKSIEAEMTDSFGLQDRVVSAALDMLPSQIGPEDRRRLNVNQDTQPAAYEAYMRGRGYFLEYEKPENIDSAVSEFERAIQIDSNFAPAYASLGEAYWMGYQQLNRGQPWLARAAENCERAQALNPALAEGHTCLGNVYYGTGKYENAVKQYQRALDLDRNSDYALGQLALAYQKLDNPSAAEAAYKKAIALRPNYWGLYSGLGLIYYSQARYEDALRAFRKVNLLAPGNYRGYSNLGGIQIFLGQYMEAIVSLRRSIELRPNRDAYTNLAAAYLALRRFPEAVDNAEMSLKLDDTDPANWGNLGDALYWTPGRRSEAAPPYQKAISLLQSKLTVNPRDSESLGYIAMYSAMLDDNKEAIESMQQALAIAPKDPYILFDAGFVYNHLGDTNRALEYLEKAIAAGYSRAQIKDNPDFDRLSNNPRYQALVERK